MRGLQVKILCFVYYISVTPSAVPSESELGHTAPCSGFEICGDNIDKHIRRRHEIRSTECDP